jgi:hypothetical protein
VKDTIIALAIVALVVVGFWWTRGAGGLPGAGDDPAHEELRRFTELGDPVSPPLKEREDREQQVE